MLFPVFLCSCWFFFLFFFFNDTATTEIYTLSLHDALPIYRHLLEALVALGGGGVPVGDLVGGGEVDVVAEDGQQRSGVQVLAAHDVDLDADDDTDGDDERPRQETEDQGEHAVRHARPLDHPPDVGGAEDLHRLPHQGGQHGAGCVVLEADVAGRGD